MNVALIGFMGTGKSTIGNELAKELSYTFIDSDNRIEQALGVSIPEIFKVYGEDYFRKLEYDTIVNIIDESGIVLSTGGGAVMNKQLFDLLLSRTIVINLEASLETLYERLKSTNNRPMLYDHDLKNRITELYRVRHPIYMKAHHSIRVDGMDIKQITNKIIKIINKL